MVTRFTNVLPGRLSSVANWRASPSVASLGAVLRDASNAPTDTAHQVLHRHRVWLAAPATWEAAKTSTVVDMLAAVARTSFRDSEVLRCINLQIPRIGPSLTFVEIGSVVTSAMRLHVSQQVAVGLLVDVKRVLPDSAAGDAVNIMWAYVNSPSVPKIVADFVPTLLGHITQLHDELDPGSLARAIWCCVKVPSDTPHRHGALQTLSMRVMALSWSLSSETVCSILTALSKLCPGYAHPALVLELCRVLLTLEDTVTPSAAGKALGSLHRIDIDTPEVAAAVQHLSKALVHCCRDGTFHDRTAVTAMTACGTMEEHFDVGACSALATYVRGRIAVLDTHDVVQALHAISKMSAGSPLRMADIVDGLLARAWVAAPSMDPLSIAILCKALSGLTEFYIQPVMGQLNRVMAKTIKRFGPREIAMTVHAMALMRRVVPCTEEFVRVVAAHAMACEPLAYRASDIAVLLNGFTSIVSDIASVPNAVIMMHKAGDLICALGENSLSSKEVTSILMSFARVGVAHRLCLLLLAGHVAPGKSYTAHEVCKCLYAMGRLQSAPRDMGPIDAALTGVAADLTPPSARAAAFAYARLLKSPPAALLSYIRTSHHTFDRASAEAILKSLDILRVTDAALLTSLRERFAATSGAAAKCTDGVVGPLHHDDVLEDAVTVHQDMLSYLA